MLLQSTNLEYPLVATLTRRKNGPDLYALKVFTSHTRLRHEPGRGTKPPRDGTTLHKLRLSLGS